MDSISSPGSQSDGAPADLGDTRASPLRPPIRLGLLGCGAAGQGIHAPRLRALRDRFDVVAVCDLDREAGARTARTVGCDLVLQDAGELFAREDLEAVAILTPVHAPWLEVGIERRLHLFVEKPFTERPEQAAALSARATEAGVRVLIGTMRAHDRLIAQARGAMAQLGTVLWVSLSDLCGQAPATGHRGDLVDRGFQSGLPTALGRRHKNALQTALLEMVHDVSILRALFGGTIVLSSSWVSSDGWALAGQLLLENGIPCWYRVTEFGWPQFEVFEIRVEIVGSNGRVCLTFGDASENAPTLLETSFGPACRLSTDCYAAEWLDFYRAVREGDRPLVNDVVGAADVSLLWRLVAEGMK